MRSASATSHLARRIGLSSLGLLLCCECASKAGHPATAVVQRPASIASASVASSSKATAPIPSFETPPAVAPTFTATWVESGRTSYATLEIGMDGELRGTPFGPWETLFNSGEPTAHVGALVTELPCAGVAPPALPNIDDDDRCHVLSMPSECAYLELVSRPKTRVTLQWYGAQPNHRAIAVLRPLVEPSWLLILADTLLSPAGPWLVPQAVDLDGDGVQDIAFVAQGVDGCDRGPCPLFWIDMLLSRTHTWMRKNSSDLLTTDNIQRRTGLGWDAVATLTWQSQAETGRYTVVARAGKRSVTWTARIEPSEVVVSFDGARAGTTKAR
jgi:hypothetical protein